MVRPEDDRKPPQRTKPPARAASVRPVIRPEGSNDGLPLYRVSTSPATADPRERKRSALLGVQLSKALHTDAVARAEAARQAYVESLSAARDQGASVAEIAAQAGVSRNALYLIASRSRKAER